MTHPNEMLVTPYEQPQPPGIWDFADPRSVVQVVTPAIAQAFEAAKKLEPLLFLMDERDLYRKLKKEDKLPSATDNRLRLKFWIEYDRCLQDGGKFIIGNVYANTISTEYFYNKYLKRPDKIAWLLCIPTGYKTKAEEALEFGLEQLRDVLELPHSFKRIIKGREVEYIDSKLAMVKLSIVKMLDDRLKGGVIQRIEQKSLSITEQRHIHETKTNLTESDMDKKIKELELRERRALNLPGGIIDAESKTLPD